MDISNKYSNFANRFDIYDLRMKTIGKIRQRFGEAVVKYGLLSDGDKILVGVSGGKDSLCLLELLAMQARIFKPQITVEALHVRMENVQYETDLEWLENFCKELGVTLHVRTTRFDKATNGQEEKPACFLCSWMRRKMMFEVAQQLGCNKIALGHHQDDIMHTTLMNLFTQGRFSTMPAMLRMEKMPLTIIRPLCMVREEDIATLAEEHHYERQTAICPHEKETMRDDMRRLFDNLEQQNPEVRFSIWKALEREGKFVGNGK